MNESCFANLPFGKVFLCYRPEFGMPDAAVISSVSAAVVRHLPGFSVELLASGAGSAGMLVARRFNLGVVSGGYGVLVAPAFPGVSIESRVATLASFLLDVESFRNEQFLFLREGNVDAEHASLDDCCTSAEVDAAPCVVRPRSFWKRLRQGAADVAGSFIPSNSGPFFRRCEKEACGKMARSTDAADSCACEEECAEEKSLDLDAGIVARGMCCEDEAVAFLDGDNTDEILSEKEALAKQIASLVRLYILKYGTVDNDKIACLLQGKMVLRDDKLSNLVVNKDCRVVLPDYDEMELNLGGPLQTSLYILFLRHPEGIVLKDVSDYIGELEGIYGMVAPNFNTGPVHNLEDPDRVTQSISKINKIIKSVFPVGDIADKYSIKGARCKPYCIPLATLEGRVLVIPKF